jgi:hypothetical protein
LAQLSSLYQLQQLSLSCCDAISNAGLAVVIALPALRALSLQSCLQLGDASLALLGQLTQLTALSLSHSCEDASSAGLLSLGSLKQLRVLNLSAASEGAAPGALARLLAMLPQVINFWYRHAWLLSAIITCAAGQRTSLCCEFVVMQLRSSSHVLCKPVGQPCAPPTLNPTCPLPFDASSACIPLLSPCS